MKVLLQNTTTQKFWSQAGWTADQTNAFNFRTSEQAMAHVESQTNEEIVVFYSFENSRYDFSIAVNG